MHSVIQPLAGRLVMLGGIILAGCTATVPTAPLPSTDPDVVGEFRPGSGYLKGYMSTQELPNSLELLAPPPVANSAAQTADDQAFQATKALRLGARGQMAFDDNNLKFPASRARDRHGRHRGRPWRARGR